MAGLVAGGRRGGNPPWISPASTPSCSRASSARRRALLSALIRIDTSNPPGNESAVAAFLDDYFRRHGLQGEIVGEPAERRSFVVSLAGSRPGPRLVLMAHEDVVPAAAEQWAEPPFAGVVKDGYVWGRGAIDVKNLLAAFCVVMTRLAEAGRDFAGEVVFVAEADEEDGAIGGARWLCANRPDLVRCDYLLNEGGGEFLVLPAASGSTSCTSARRAPPSSAWSSPANRVTPRCRCAAATPWWAPPTWCAPSTTTSRA